MPSPALLTSSDQVQQAVDAGQVSTNRTDAVINAPLLTSPGGKR
jgi:hypothetical protein